MLQDIQHGRDTEIEFINVAVVSLGEKHAIATPTNRTLVELIRF